MAEPRDIILIAEDDADLADNLAELTAGLGLCPKVVSNARCAIEVGTTEAVLVALVDLHLPDGHGRDVARSLRQRTPYTRVILVTGDATIETAVAAVSDGAFAYLPKPFAPQALLDTIERAAAEGRILREQERLRLELESSERRHRELVETVPAFVMAVNEAGTIVLWNRRLEDVTGLSRVEMLGQDGRALLGGEGIVSLPSRKGSGPVRVRWEQAVVRTGSGETMTYAVGIDVTQEQEMLRRTLRAERLAAVGTLAAGLAHEIRNPLNAAALQVTLLGRRLDKLGIERSLLESTITPVIGIIQEEIARLERLVSEFLAFARPRQIEPVPTDIDALLRSVLDLVRPEAENLSIAIVERLAGDLPVLALDAEQIKQVVLNLVRNAIEAMPDGGQLTVRSRQVDGEVRVEVEDTGSGIEEDMAVFDAFFTTKPSGTGLGLSLAHRIVSDHGGQISFDSRPGRTCFSFTLPVR